MHEPLDPIVLNLFLIELAKDLQAVKGKIQTSNSIKREELESFAEDIFLKASKSLQKEKMDAFRSIFLNTVLSDHLNMMRLQK